MEHTAATPRPTQAPQPPRGQGAVTARVLDVRHWTDSLFSFRVERPASFRFRSGAFVMLGLPADRPGSQPPAEAPTPPPVMRAYSIASPAWDDGLDFYSIKVPDGALTSRLQHLQAGDSVLLHTKAVGTLSLDALLPGHTLWMLATGTGIAPFASLLRDPDTYTAYERVVVMHACRTPDELAYGRHLVDGLSQDPLVGETAPGKVLYYPTTTRTPSERMGRITDNLASGKVFADLGLPPVSPARDRVMVCGSLAFNRDVQSILKGLGMIEGSLSRPQHFVVEKAFVGEGV